MPRLACLALTLALAACSAGTDTDYPSLLPTSTLLGDAALTPDPAPGLEARAADLRARADALRAPVVPEGELPAN
ncbi:hypothetical protein O5O51_11960 [Sinirhodobacter sp. HNIBRBA609]|nr:hypothetical protein O5O51_11960 [Sinirhodobacter sp. HNIBRBA609]